ncbi:hypothetical protein CPB85DRAFT_1424446 [Mucidula mucida]|nr:hypothetical protein CPB85DRAFT_1424446 [Mucidula mucida]
MSYSNPLHPASVPSSSQVYSLSAPAKFALPNRRRVPQRAFAPKHGPSQNPQPTIYYDYPGFQHQGVPMQAFGASEPAIAGAKDAVFTKPGVTRITFHILASSHFLWPGYPQVEWYRSVEVTTRTGPLTRAQLGYVVVGNYMRFIEKTQYESINAAERHWKVGADGIRLENLVILSVWNTYENSWQAEIAVDL